MNSGIILASRIFMIFKESGDGPPIGTGFLINSPEIVLTADHVVREQSCVRIVNTSIKGLSMTTSCRIINHQAADIAAIILPKDAWKSSEPFELGFPPAGYSDHPLGEEVLSYGFPQMGTEKPIPPRLMKGHLQRQFQYQDELYEYKSFELGFPAFHGQSGSPVILDNLTKGARKKVIGLVTKSISFKSETGGQNDRSIMGDWSVSYPAVQLDK